jgi:hypothetical protein
LRPIAGTNTTITGTYPNLTFNATATPIDTSSLSIRISALNARIDNQTLDSVNQRGNNTEVGIIINQANLALQGVGPFTANLVFANSDPYIKKLQLGNTIANNVFVYMPDTSGTLALKSDIINTDTSSLSDRIYTKYDSVSINSDSTKYNFWSNSAKVDSVSSLVKNLYGVGRIILIDSSNGNGYIKLDTLGLVGGSAIDTSSLSNRIKNAYSSIQSSLDSSYFVITKPNGLQDTIEVQTYSGGSGGGGVVMVKQIHTTGATLTVNNTTTWLIIKPTLSSLTITLPASPTDGQRIDISFKLAITSLTVSPNTGQTISDAFGLTSIEAGESIAYQYDSTDLIWYRL